MNDFDPADLDGDGEFDAIDIAILEEEEGKQKQTPGRNNNGCCFSLMVLGLSVSTVVVSVKLYFA